MACTARVANVPGGGKRRALRVVAALRPRGRCTTAVAAATSDPRSEQLVSDHLIREALGDVVLVLHHGHRLLHGIVREAVGHTLGPKLEVVGDAPSRGLPCALQVLEHVAPSRPRQGHRLGGQAALAQALGLRLALRHASNVGAAGTVVAPGVPESGEGAIQLLRRMRMALLGGSSHGLARDLLHLLGDHTHLRDELPVVLPILLLDGTEVLHHALHAVPDLGPGLLDASFEQVLDHGGDHLQVLDDLVRSTSAICESLRATPSLSTPIAAADLFAHRRHLGLHVVDDVARGPLHVLADPLRDLFDDGHGAREPVLGLPAVRHLLSRSLHLRAQLRLRLPPLRVAVAVAVSVGFRRIGL
mmetsp:Transcript_7936/g.20205  ORF Transcript_7936/g.20205 Transcript_7936/m.20205 type:complete len:359 (-) Transcript_7936:556-1632(-)